MTEEEKKPLVRRDGRGIIRDWEALKLEWLGSNETLNVFKKKKGLPDADFFGRIRRHKWREAKREILKRTEEEVAKRLINKGLEEWKGQIKLWKHVESIAEQILNKYKNGELAQNPNDLSALTCAIERSLKSRKLILGEATETREVRSVHAVLTQIIKEAEDGPEDSFGEEYLK